MRGVSAKSRWNCSTYVQRARWQHRTDWAFPLTAYVYAKRQGLSDETIRYATEIRLDAERKLGAILADTPKSEGGRPSKTPAELEGVSIPTIKELGLDYKTSARAQKLAELPDETYEVACQGESRIPPGRFPN